LNVFFCVRRVSIKPGLMIFTLTPVPRKSAFRFSARCINAALLAGGSLDKEFTLSPLPAKDGLDWALATPKAKDGSFKSVRVGFRGKQLASIEVVDAFGQRSLLQFNQFAGNVPLSADNFVFKLPKGADLIEQ